MKNPQPVSINIMLNGKAISTGPYATLHDAIESLRQAEQSLASLLLGSCKIEIVQ